MSQKPRVRIIVSDSSGVILEKEFNQLPISFGRNPNSQVVLPFEFVSRSHCMLVEDDDGISLVDMHSAHGVFVGGAKIDRIKVSSEVTILIKSLTVKIEIVGEQKVDHAAATAVATGLGSLNTLSASVATPEKPVIVAAAAPAPAIPAVAKFNPVPKPSEKANASNFPSPGLAGFQSHVIYSDRVPLVSKDFRPLLFGAHPSAFQAQFRKVEATVSWHDVIYDVQEFDPSDKITVGPVGHATISLPIFRRSMTVAKVGKDKTKCFALSEHQVTVSKGQKEYSKVDLLEINQMSQKGHTLNWSFDPNDTTSIDFGNGVNLHLRYVPGTKALSRSKMIEPDEAFKQSVIGSGILHLVLAMIIFLMAPPASKGPKIKNVPERYARLLVQKPKPKPTPPPQVKQEVVKKEPPKPVVEKVVKHVPIKTPKVLAKKNKFPMEVKHPVAKAPPPVKVEALGALGALGAMSKTPSNVPTNININANAGGLPQKALNTGGIVGALPSSNGKLAAAGGAAVKTKGFGYGTGTGYGMQGLKGTAGTRGVAGAIVGEPKLAAMAKVEGLTRAQVMSVLKQYMSEVQHCYEKNLLSNPDLAGRIDFEWDIGPSGKVTDVRVKRSTVNNGDVLVECVRKLFFAMPFPAAKNGMITTPNIGFPFGRI